MNHGLWCCQNGIVVSERDAQLYQLGSKFTDFHLNLPKHRGASASCLLIEGDEQLDRPNNQTTMELSHTCVA